MYGKPYRPQPSAPEPAPASAPATPSRKGDAKKAPSFRASTRDITKLGVKPDAKKAQEYFTTVTLPKHVKDEDGNYQKTEPGAEEGELYDVWGTPAKELFDFGMGIGLYYIKLLGMATFFLIFFCVLIPNQQFFDSSEYRPSTASFVDSAVEVFESTSILLRGSAECSGASVVGVQFSPFSTWESSELPGCENIQEKPSDNPVYDCNALLSKMDNATFSKKQKDYTDLGRKELPRGGLYIGHYNGKEAWEPKTCAETFGDGAIPKDQTDFRYCPGGRMNTCVLDKDTASYTMAIFVVLILICYAFDQLIEHANTIQDESEQTASDYSVVVMDPRPDATDPDDWKHFFEEQCGFGKVVCVTVALNNAKLMKQLAALDFINEQLRFEIDEDAMKSVPTSYQEQISKADPADGLPLDEDFSKWCGGFGGCLQLLGIGQDAAYFVKKQKICKSKIAELKDGPKPGEKYSAVRIFAIFEDEHSQRKCLHTMAMGIIPAMLDTKSAVPLKYQRNGNVLDVREAPEATNIIYENLEASALKTIAYWVVGNFFAVAFVIVGFFIVAAANQANPTAGALAVTILNSLYPTVFKAIGHTEIHQTVTSKKSSLLLKLVCARLFNTAIVTWLATPYEHTLDPRFIESIQMILVFDMILTPILRFLDIAERVKQMILAPRSKTQAKMDQYFQGTNFWIAERYTDLLKTAFVALLYVSLVPSGMFFACGSFFVSYWVDKYCLLRRWKTPPRISHLITSSSNFYLLLCVVVSLFYTTYFYSNWSYDNVCAVDKTCWDNKHSTSCILPDDQRFFNSTFITCGKRLFENEGGDSFFWPTRVKHMTIDQVDVMEEFRILSIVAIALFFLTKVLGPIVQAVQLLYKREHQNSADPSNVKYTEIVNNPETEICGYVPNCTHNELLQTHPLLMSDIEMLDARKELISFSMPENEYGDVCAYNTYMFPDLANYSDEQLAEDTHPSFGICKYYGDQELDKSTMEFFAKKSSFGAAESKEPINEKNVESALSA